MRIRLAPQARSDLDEIWLYVACGSGSPLIATRHIESIVRRFQLLANFPFIGRSLEATGRSNIRSLAAGNYLVFLPPG
jgi:plasmid stabilization system protein ParE